VPKKGNKKTKPGDECAPDESEACAKESDEKSRAEDLRPYDQKIGEPAQNLRRRSEWFEKRSGSGKA
jgi:hypothetical protein